MRLIVDIRTPTMSGLQFYGDKGTAYLSPEIAAIGMLSLYLSSGTIPFEAQPPRDRGEAADRRESSGKKCHVIASCHENEA